MHHFLFVFIFTMYQVDSMHFSRDAIFQSLVNRISYQLHPYRVVVFINNTTTHNDILCQRILHNLPSITIDLGKMAITANNKSLSSPILRYPTPSTLYIISESQDDDDRNYIGRLKNTLNAIVEASPILPRPKCLIIFHSKSLSFQDHLESVLVYAWSQQFLDFTIVIATANSQPLMFNYNAFTNMFYKRTLTAHMWLFPYKLRNMWAHPLKIPAIELPPYLYPIRDSSGKVVGMEGMSYQYVKIFSEVMNFTVDFVTGAEDSVLRANFSVIFKKLYTNEIDMLTFPFNVRSIMYEFRDWLLMGKLFLNTNYVIVVPIVPLLRVDIPLEIMICIPLLAIIIFIYVVSAKLLRFPRGHWKVFKIFQILLGVTVMRKPPRKLVEKIVYFSLIVLSMKYSIDTITKIMDIKLIKGEVAFDTLEEIATSKLPIYTLDFIIDHVYGNNDDKTIEELRKKTFATVDMYQCVYQVVDNKSCMCITPHSAGNQKASNHIIIPKLYRNLIISRRLRVEAVHQRGRRADNESRPTLALRRHGGIWLCKGLAPRITPR